MIEYRISWEAKPGPSHPWMPTERIFTDAEDTDGFDQFETLKRWAESGEEPVRNVKLEWRQPSVWELMPVEELP